jgi:hypothetical protein
MNTQIEVLNASLVSRAASYMSKVYGKKVTATPDGNLTVISDSPFGAYTTTVGYVCADGKLIDVMGDRDEILVTLR